MGLLSRTSTFVRYSVEGQLPDKFWDFAAERIAQFSFRDIDETFDEYSIGWVSVDNMFDSTFAHASYAVGDQIVLAMRIDERKVSPTLLKKFSLKEEDRLKKERQIPRLSRSQRVQIKEDIRLQLVKKALPVPSVYELSWNLANNTVLFFSISTKAQSILEDFFKESFGFTVILQVPYLAAANLLDDSQQERLKEIQPEILV
ncbi:MAG: DNA recombination-dependent growth factor C [Desulfobacterales bacterium]|jgi:DNA recombination-dependent growth factor C|nr:DNA recombination-dependent growth factor C [Desulfobacterales bacterium]